jgi:hypothetical protein
LLAEAKAGRGCPDGGTRRSIVELAAESEASHLASGDRRYLVAVNRNFAEPIDLAIKLDPAIAASLVIKDGQLHAVVANRYQRVVRAGDAAILALGRLPRQAVSAGGFP